MALQTDDLVMAGLGIFGDFGHDLQPSINAGIHLRWGFKRELGFPWFGFYLFRRPSKTSFNSDEKLVLTNKWNNPPIGLLSSKTLTIAGFGEFNSDTNLGIVDRTVPTGQREIDLQSRSFVRFTFEAGLEARWVQLDIHFGGAVSCAITGFRGSVAVTQTIVTGQANAISTVTLQADKLTAIELTEIPGSIVNLSFVPLKRGIITPPITQFHYGWDPAPGFPQPLTLPIYNDGYPANHDQFFHSYAESRTIAQNRIQYGSPTAFVPTPTTLSTGSAQMTFGSTLFTGANTAWNQSLVGKQLVVGGFPYTILAVINSQKLIVDRPWRGVSGSNPYTITDDVFATLYNQLQALVDGNWVIGSPSYSTLGPMVSRSLPLPIATGQASVTKGSATVNGANTNWTTDLVDLPIQFTLTSSGTVFLRRYSTTVVGKNTSWRHHLVGGLLYVQGAPKPYRILRVDSATQLTLDRPYAGVDAVDKTYSIVDRKSYKITAVTSTTGLILDRVYAGPTASNITYTIEVPLQAQDSQSRAPVMQRQYPLDLILLGALHPAIAQMIGLYWIDPGSTSVAYDYLLIADYVGNATRAGTGGTTFDPQGMLAHLYDTNFADVEAAVVFNKTKQVAVVNPAPANVVAYQLPDNAAGGALSTQGNGSVGLRWDAGLNESGTLLPGRAVAYHVWRADLGVNKPGTQPSANSYNLISVNPQNPAEPHPIMVPKTLVAPGKNPQRPPDWPKEQLFMLDNHLQDGWYSYAISGIDIFGRHSAKSAPAQWKQWAPMPQPRPWYYQDPEGPTTIHQYAVHILDKIPPPPPTGVEAYLLDPADPLLVRDAVYNAWYAQLGAADKGKVGLRVQWRWMTPHMQQAPDTQEFRIYLHPGKELPPGDHDSATWQQRYFVVNYNQNVTITTDEFGRPMRVYDLIIPPPGNNGPWSPLTPTRANPVAFGHIGVSAADNKPHTADNPKWNGTALGGRVGNEGRVGPVARIFQVLRTPPPPPVPPPADGDLVYATPADYHDRSYLTYRWAPQADLKTHVLRAMDETLFLIDWAQRPRAGSIDVSLFPGDPRWNSAKKQQVTTELAQLNAIPHTPAGQEQALAIYRGLSNDALRVLAGLPGNEKAFTQLTIEPLEPGANPGTPETKDRRGPDDPAGYTPNAQLRAYQDTLDGRARNRYLYRSMYVDKANNRSALSLASAPVGLPDTVPPQAPVIFKLLGGDRQAVIQWNAPLEATTSRYQIYRTSNAECARDIRLMGSPVADLPAQPLVVQNKTVDLGASTLVTKIERVYAAAQFNSAADLLTGQKAPQYLPTPVTTTNTQISGLTAPDQTPVVVVYRDHQKSLQYTPGVRIVRSWTDHGIASGTVNYRVVATRQGTDSRGTVLVPSLPSEAKSTRVIDLSIPSPPTITTLQWVQLRSDGQIFPYTDSVPATEVRVPAVQLSWTAADLQLTCLVQARCLPDGDWQNVSGWIQQGTYTFVHANNRDSYAHEYRIKVRNLANTTNSTYAIAILAAAR